MSKSDPIKSIKSVNIRSITIKRRLLMSPTTVKTFQSFLEGTIGDEVLIISTNIGMEIYYYGSNDCGDFIKNHALLYIFKHIDTSKLKFRNSIDSEEVLKKFTDTIVTFAQYPQLFLAYAKKFIRLKENNTDSKFVIPMLNAFFEDTIKELAASGKMPHYEKIQREKMKSQKSVHHEHIIEALISEVLLKKHRN